MIAPLSIQELIGLTKIERQCLFLSDGSIITALACQSLPIALRGGDEALQIILALKEIFCALPLAIQLLTEVGPLDVDAFLNAHRQASQFETQPTLRRLAEQQRRFVSQLAANQHLLERRCYLLLRLVNSAPPTPRRPGDWLRRQPTTAASSATPTARLGQLATVCQELSAGLRTVRISSRRLTDHELANLFYHCLLPGLADRQPLPVQLNEIATGPVHYRSASSV